MSTGTATMQTRSHCVSRCLFGKPDHEELGKWLTEQLHAIEMDRMKLYGFDFKNAQPIASTASKAYIFEAVPENEVPQFYRTAYYPSKERRKLYMPPPPIVAECNNEKLDDSDDVVAYHTRSRAAAAAKISNFVLPKIPKSRIAAVAPQSSRLHDKGKVQRPPSLKARASAKLSQTPGVRNKSMKQPKLTNYLPVVFKRRSLSYSRSECSDSPKLLDDSPVRMECQDAKVLNVKNTGVKTRCQSRRCPDTPSKRLRSAF